MARRILARLRARYPLSFVLLPLFSGQLLGAIGWGLWGILIIIGCLCLLWTLLTVLNVHRVSALIFLSGFISTALLFQHETILKTSPYLRYLVEVAERPRRSQPNDLSLTLIILETFQNENAKLIQIEDVSKGKTVLCRSAELPWKNISGIEIGDRFMTALQFRPLKKSNNPFSYETTLRRHGITSICKILYVGGRQSGWAPLASLRHVIVQKITGIFPDSLDVGVFLSLLFGIRDAVPTVTEREFKDTGLAHLLVFSGAQVVLMYGLLYSLVRFFYLKISNVFNIYTGAWIVSVIPLLSCVVFVTCVGLDITTLRALIALAVSWIAKRFERGGGIWHAIINTAIVLSILWPGCLFEPSAQLTFAALIGIGLGLSRGGFIAMYFFTSLATSFVCVLWFHQFSLSGLVLNPLLVPTVSLLSCSVGVVAFFVFVVGLDSGGFCINWLSWILGFAEDLIHRISMTRFAAFDLNTQEVVLVATLLGSILLGESFLSFRRALAADTACSKA